MARLGRIVIPALPHQVTQRGNRRQPTFYSDRDYRAYMDLMADWCERVGVAIWAYCLMPNHIHLIAVPAAKDGLRRAIGEAHRRYSRRINDRIYPTAQCFYADPACDMHNRMKEALVLLGRLPRATVRPPLAKLSAAEITRIEQTIKAAGLTRQGVLPEAAE